MKTQVVKLLLCSIFAFLLFSSKAHAQYIVNGKEIDTTVNTSMNHIFGTLDPSKIPFGLLRDYAMEFTNLENFDGTALVDSNIVDKGIFREIYVTLATARISAGSYTTLPSPNTMDSISYLSRQPGQVSFSGLFYQYSYLDPNSANNGEITVTSGQLFDKYVNGVWQNPYLQGNAIAFAPTTDSYGGQSFNMILPANLWFTNSGSLVSSIQVDAGDGLGYRTLRLTLIFP